MTLITPPTTRAIGTILTAAIYNADHTNHYVNELALDASFNNVYTKGQSDSLFAPQSSGSIAKRRMLLGVDGVDGEDGIPSPRGRMGPPGASFIERFAVIDASTTLLDSTAAQDWFPAGYNEFNAEIATYAFDAFLWLARSAGGLAYNVQSSFIGTAVISAIDYYVVARHAAGAGVAANPLSGAFSVATASIFTTSVGSTTLNTMAKFYGTVRFTSAGTFQPQVQLSAAPGATGLIKRGTYFRMLKLGGAAVTNSSDWS